jgi:hypothetical protein
MLAERIPESLADAVVEAVANSPDPEARRARIEAVTSGYETLVEGAVTGDVSKALPAIAWALADFELDGQQIAPEKLREALRGLMQVGGGSRADFERHVAAYAISSLADQFAGMSLFAERMIGALGIELDEGGVREARAAGFGKQIKVSGAFWAFEKILAAAGVSVDAADKDAFLASCFMQMLSSKGPAEPELKKVGRAMSGPLELPPADEVFKAFVHGMYEAFRDRVTLPPRDSWHPQIANAIDRETEARAVAIHANRLWYSGERIKAQEIIGPYDTIRAADCFSPLLLDGGTRDAFEAIRGVLPKEKADEVIAEIGRNYDGGPYASHIVKFVEDEIDPAAAKRIAEALKPIGS